MAAASRIVRGADWGESLSEILTIPPAGTTAWMDHHTRLLKSDTYSRAGLLELREMPCFLKLYLAKSAWQKLGFRLGYGRGMRSFDAASELARAGLPVPEPRTCLLVPEGMALLTEGFDDGRDLRSMWLAQATAQESTQLLRCAGETLARLHGAGYAHGDCKWGNLLWSGQQLYLVDLESVCRLGRSPGRMADDLARFTIDAEELGLGPDLYNVFLDAYLGDSASPRDALIRQVLPRVAAIRARHAARYGVESEHLL